jgi:hypothetical protein
LQSQHLSYPDQRSALVQRSDKSGSKASFNARCAIAFVLTQKGRRQTENRNTAMRSSWTFSCDHYVDAKPFSALLTLLSEFLPSIDAVEEQGDSTDANVMAGTRSSSYNAVESRFVCAFGT